ncbi:polysaccharide pyruvyl transferase family protein [Coleofasciculus sp. FACHB-SPT9]|uniref:polysaccharide pyruvyl transferase family protein n=1 Tax=Cyanophyceae TaxID=3028117 RepID=UPI0016858D6B|nr:polysaccharide pyruvyl transferase family protein [Coleofasciculus sp. FACHB-SPT9]MBD1889613.1 polysaccharide pyruvyl transferase family protein [Coleofasciculus sp. FACHB-SPT9]
MKILIEQGSHPLGNMGDIAMLQVTVARLRSLWPSAVFEIFTTVPDRLSNFCSDAYSLWPAGHNIWSHPLFDKLYENIPNSVVQNFLKLEWKLRYISPLLVTSIIQFNLKAQQIENKNFNSLLQTVKASDLVVACGGGYITDVFEEKVTSVLGFLGLATALGKPTVMLGQGLGPLQNPKLRLQAKAVLPHINLISLRESRAAIPLLNSLGVSPKRIVTTGDDAIELAYEARSQKLENGIGINLRIAKYSEVNSNLLEIVRASVQDSARKKGAPLIPVPISHTVFDAKTIQMLLAEYDDTSDGGQSLDTPLKVIEQVKHCRVVVTGSYHAGVFALAQGIPVIGLAKSQYYKDKFLGLADQFGAGCDVILLEDERLRDKLMSAIDNAWRLSETIRPQLLESAKRQIELGHDAYRRVYNLVESGSAKS